ncbi:EscU/YscU/HrcU family type III secretion system export apparatus switch protein, partial [Escherichia coli]
MSDESDDKTEAPTPHRLEKAREEGQIPRSRELNRPGFPGECFICELRLP